PESKRALFRDARDRALAAWRHAIPALQFSVAPSGEMSFDFAAGAPTDGAHITPAATYTRSWAGGGNVLHGTIMLSRGQPPEPVSEVDVYNEVAYAASSYLGLLPGRYVGTAAARSDYPSTREATLMQDEIAVAGENLVASDVLRKACADHTALQTSIPHLEISAIQETAQHAMQGMRVPIQFHVANKGNRPLELRLQPACGCISAAYQSVRTAGSELDV